MDNKEKKFFIYDKINKIENHTKIINFIKKNNIKFTENNKTFLINISTIPDELINELYIILNYDYLDSYSENKDYEQFTSENSNSDDNLNNNTHKENNIKNKYKKHNIFLKNFNSSDKKLILLSKKYKFEKYLNII